MSTATETRPPDPSVEEDLSPPDAEVPAPESEPQFSKLSKEDWEGTPPNAQVFMVSQATEIVRLNEVIRILQVALYGSKSEKDKPKKKDCPESGAAELPSDESKSEPASDSQDAESGPGGEPLPDPPSPPAPGKGRGRKKLPANLPRRQVIVDVSNAQKLCPCCGKEKPSFLSDDNITEKFGFIQAQVFVWQFLRPTYIECPCDKKREAPAATPSAVANPPDPVALPSSNVTGVDTLPNLPTTPEARTPCVSPPRPVVATPISLGMDSKAIPPSPPVMTRNDAPELVCTTPPPPSASSAVDTPTMAAAPTTAPGPTEPLPVVSARINSALEPIIITQLSNRLPGEPSPAIITAAPVPQLIRKGLATHGLLVEIIVSKVLYGMPLYRQAARFLSLGVDIDRTTMCGWLINVGRILACIMAALRLEVRSGRVLHADETPFKVLAERVRKGSAQCYMWLFAGGTPGKLAVEFLYDSSRSADVPRHYLEGYTGDVLTDGYGGYDFLLKWAGIVLLACWVHVRRKFHDVIKAIPKELRGKRTFAHQVLAHIRVLYRLEKYADQEHFTEDQRRELRQQRAKPIVEALKVLLDEQQPKVPEKTKLGEAIGYALHMWPRLLHFLDKGYRPLDNNWIENLVRPFAVGRKAWMFCATVEGAAAMATFHSLIATAVLNGLDPAKYLRALFDQLAVLLETSDPIHGPTPEQCRALLPQYIDRELLAAEVPESRFILST